jgi:hypothetical protein
MRVLAAPAVRAVRAAPSPHSRGVWLATAATVVPVDPPDRPQVPAPRSQDKGAATAATEPLAVRVVPAAPEAMAPRVR